MTVIARQSGATWLADARADAAAIAVICRGDTEAEARALVCDLAGQIARAWQVVQPETTGDTHAPR